MSAWVQVEDTRNLKACPACGALALEGETECTACGCVPDDDEAWRNAPMERSACALLDALERYAWTIRQVSERPNGAGGFAWEIRVDAVDAPNIATGTTVREALSRALDRVGHMDQKRAGEA